MTHETEMDSVLQYKKKTHEQKVIKGFDLMAYETEMDSGRHDET